MSDDQFMQLLWQQGEELFRSMPWRETTDPYLVLVSELMLQQTQVDRVMPKYAQFIERFPSVADLSEAPLSDVLQVWQGLGYNRRAKFLHMAARYVVERGGVFPSTYEELVKLPGVGPNTAGAILAYAYNTPVVYVETNIRTVVLHHFFPDEESVDDRTIRAVVERVLPADSPRQFYWAMMDYGSFLKRSGVRRNSQSRHYKKQLPLAGSVREVRGQIVRYLTEEGDVECEKLVRALSADERFDAALSGLMRDGLIQQSDNIVYLTK